MLMKALIFLSSFLFIFNLQAETSQEVAGLISQKKYVEAEIIIIKQLVQNKKNELALFNMGVVLYQTKKFEQSYPYFDRVASMNLGYALAARYYSALALFNLQKDQEVETRLNQIPVGSAFKEQSDELLLALQNKSDESLTEALQAYSDADYEYCIETLVDSLYADHPRGIQLMNLCQKEINLEKNEKIKNEKIKIVKNSHEIYIYADLNGGVNNNIYTSAIPTTSAGIVQATLGFEYLYKTSFDIGLGANYDYNNVPSIADYQDTYINSYIPLNFYFDNADLSTELYFNVTRSNSVNSYSQKGGNLSYIYHLTKVDLGATVDYSQRKSAIASYDYVNGSYSSLRFDLTYDQNPLKFNLFGSYTLNQSQDIVLTGGTLPYANRAIDTGILGSYKVTSNLKLVGFVSMSRKDYTNQYTTISRNDQTQLAKIKIDYRISENAKIYLENERTTNKSSYDKTQVSDKNYVENITRLGFYLNN